MRCARHGLGFRHGRIHPFRPIRAALQLAALCESLQRGLVERGREVRLSLLAALAGEHTLLIGPPGTAKSELARRLHLALAAATTSSAC